MLTHALSDLIPRESSERARLKAQTLAQVVSQRKLTKLTDRAQHNAGAKSTVCLKGIF